MNPDTSHRPHRAVVVGSGPNGLTAAAILASQGWQVDVYEANAKPGGAAISGQLFSNNTAISDFGAAAHPFGVASPIFRELKLEEHGLKWLHSEFAMAHPLEKKPAALLARSVEETASYLGKDEKNWVRLHGHITKNIDQHLSNLLGPMLRWPKHPLRLASFGLPALSSAKLLTNAAFRSEEAKVLFAGSAVHAIAPPSQPFTAAFGLLFGSLGMSRGWPVAHGGTQAISDALLSVLKKHNAIIHLNSPVTDLRELPRADATILNLTPRQILNLRGLSLNPLRKPQLKRWRYGVATYKVDYLLSEPVPWADENVCKATTVHVCGTLEEIDAAEKTAAQGRLPEEPFVMVCQQHVADPARGLTLWTYAHVPHGFIEAYPGQVAEKIEAQISRFAPNFRDAIVEKHTHTPADLEQWNSNLIGGDIAGGAMDGLQSIVRPGYRLGPRTYLASSTAPPGAGVHGMPGAWAARAAIKDALKDSQLNNGGFL